MKRRSQITFNDTDRKDRRLAGLEHEYAMDTDYTAIPEKAGNDGTVHYMLIAELEKHARVLLLRQAIAELYPNANLDAGELHSAYWPAA